MKTVLADFNALETADTVRLTCRGSLKSIQDQNIQEGETVWLCDDEIRAKAVVRLNEGQPFGEVDWSTVEDV